MTAKQKQKQEEEIHQKVLERISQRTREEWLEIIAEAEAKQKAADAAVRALQVSSHSKRPAKAA